MTFWCFGRPTLQWSEGLIPVEVAALMKSNIQVWKVAFRLFLPREASFDGTGAL